MLKLSKALQLTRQQRGEYFNVELVGDDSTRSFSTKKEFPGVGHSIVLQEGAAPKTGSSGKTSSISVETNSNGSVLNTGSTRFLLKKVTKFGDKAWLFRNLGKEKGGEAEPAQSNKYLDMIAKKTND